MPIVDGIEMFLTDGGKYVKCDRCGQTLDLQRRSILCHELTSEAIALGWREVAPNVHLCPTEHDGSAPAL